MITHYSNVAVLCSGKIKINLCKTRNAANCEGIFGKVHLRQIRLRRIPAYGRRIPVKKKIAKGKRGGRTSRTPPWIRACSWSGNNYGEV